MLGRPTVFVRSGGCGLRCKWCDSLHAVLPEHKGTWRSMEPGEIMDCVRELAPDPILVTLSGGDPAMQPFGALIHMGHTLGYRFVVETQGMLAPAWLSALDVLVLSPKPPSSGMPWRRDRLEASLRAASLGVHVPDLALKVPVFDADDLDWVERELCPLPAAWPRMPLYLSVGNDRPTGEADIGALLAHWRWLSEEVVRRRLDVIVTPQAHTLLYGNERRR